MPVSASIIASALCTSFSIRSMRFDNLRTLGFVLFLTAAAFSGLMLAVLDRVRLAGGPSLCGGLSRVIGWLTLGSDCFISRSLDCCSLPIAR